MHHIGHFLRHIIIMIVVLYGCKCHEDRAAGHIDRMAEAVARRVVPEFHGFLVTRVVHVGVALDAHIGLAHHVELADSERRNAVVDAAVGGSVALRVVGEVERLTHLSRLEQCGVALGIYFRHLVFHG